MAAFRVDPPTTWLPVRGLTVVAATIMAIAVSGLLMRTKLPIVLPPHCWAMTASTCFLFLASVSWWICRGGRASWILAGIACCWLGDYLGLVKFEYGALSFLLAHVCFVIGFLWQGIARQRLALVTSLVALLTGVTAYWLLPHVLPKDGPLVIGYMVVISFMAIAAGIAAVDRWRFLMTAAAIFYVSDIAVAGWRFVTPDDPSWKFICYPLYYTACLMLAVSPLVMQHVQGTNRPC